MNWQIFADRVDAGRRLAARLAELRPAQPLVLALPRGGVPVGFEVARMLHAPLDIVIVRKIGAPFQPELAVGAVVDGDRPEIVTNPELVNMLKLDAAWLKEHAEAELAEIGRRHRVYRVGRPQPEIAGRSAIVVDDGIATGATMRAALAAVRRARPARLILAVPVAPPDTVAALRPEVDEVVCLETPEPFWAIGAFYADFSQTSDEEVIDLLKRAAEFAASPGPAPKTPGGG
jgi:putative phosphoribosyl transferase